MEELEIPFVRVLHLLAHHPDLDKLHDVAGEDGSEVDGEEAAPKQTKHETLLSLSKCVYAPVHDSHSQPYDRYIQFYVDQLVNAENISLIYHLALKVKTVRDSDGDEASEVQPLPSSLPFPTLTPTAAPIHRGRAGTGDPQAQVRYAELGTAIVSRQGPPACRRVRTGTRPGRTEARSSARVPA